MIWRNYVTVTLCIMGQLYPMWSGDTVNWVSLRSFVSIYLSSAVRSAVWVESVDFEAIWRETSPGVPYEGTASHPVDQLVCSLFAVARPSVCLSVCLSSVTFVRPTQAVQIFGNISTALGTLAIHWHTLKISRRSSQRNPSAGGVKHKRGSHL